MGQFSLQGAEDGAEIKRITGTALDVDHNSGPRRFTKARDKDFQRPLRRRARRAQRKRARVLFSSSQC
jgi:hypothetical protein